MTALETAQKRAPFPPFTRETAIQKVRMAEDGWNSRTPEKVAPAYSMDSWWRNRAEFIQGRPAIVEFLTRKWKKELDYRLIKELWAFDGSRIAVRFAYEPRNGSWREPLTAELFGKKGHVVKRGSGDESPRG